MKNTNTGDVLRCSFCNKSQKDVKKLIAGPTAYICDECVDICLDIIAEDRDLVDVSTGEQVPKGLIEAADRITPGHTETKRLLAAAITQHATRTAEPAGAAPTPMFIGGPSGTGRNDLAKAMVKAAGLPFVVLEVPLLFPDAAFSARHDFAGFDKRPGIVLLNQLDAAAMRGPDKDESRRVQQTLISILDGAVLSVTSEDKAVVLDTSRVLFIATGSFADLTTTPGQRLTPDVLIRCGYLPELVARFGVMVLMEPLGDDSLRECLTREGGLIAGCKERFQKSGLEVTFEPAAIERLVRLGETRKTGIHGLRTMMDTIALTLACEAPEGGKKFLVDEPFIVRSLT